MGQPQHPGAKLRELLEERGWSQADLIFVLRCVPKTVNQIINGKQGISPAMSLMLGDALGLPPDYFADLQTKYEIEMAERPDPAIGARAKVIARYPIREMIKRGWVQNDRPDELENQLCRFFGTNSLDDISDIAHSAKKTSYSEITGAQLAWLFRVRQIAKSLSVPKFSQTRLSDSLYRMRELLIAPEEARHAPRILAECGVRFVLVEALPSSKIDGVCFWLDQNSPVIGMSMRFDRMDNFWFVLRHEIEHVLKGHGKISPEGMIDTELYGEHAGTGDSIPEEERIANLAAADFCVKRDKMASFIARKTPFFYEKDVIAFAKINNVHPSLPIGQIQHETGRFEYLRKFQVKIRQFVLPGAIADGWGQSPSLAMEM
jgi:HTH-type transcriptional regulator/antitoxin HigA